MKKRRLVIFILSACAAVLLFPALSRLPLEKTASAPAAAAAVTESSSGQTLFPGFSVSDTTAVSITTPQAIFDLRREENQLVSINGQRGDREVFATLLEQIADMTIVPIEAFTSQDTPLLTLIVRQADTEYTAVFYDDNAAGEFAHIIVRGKDTPTYAKTDGWRVGTLMLACEGMRMQDESGRETPLMQNTTEQSKIE